jgi:hypothetical protein
VGTFGEPVIDARTPHEPLERVGFIPMHARIFSARPSF